MCVGCEELREENRQLRAELYAHEYQAPSAFGLSATQERILGMLIRLERPVPRWLLFDATRALPGTHAVEEHDKLIHTIVCKLRQRIRPHGLEIETVYGRGYRLTPASRSRLLNWTTAPADEAA